MTSLLRSASATGQPVLLVTQRDSGEDPEHGQVLRVTTLAGTTGTLDPKRLADLHEAATAFLSREEDGLVLLDCLDFLVLHNGAERVQRALADLHDEVTVRGGSLVVLVDDERTNPRLIAWLQRELDSLPDLRDLATERPGLIA